MALHIILVAVQHPLECRERIAASAFALRALRVMWHEANWLVEDLLELTHGLQAWAGPARGGAGSVKFIFISKENYLRFCIKYLGHLYIRFRVYIALPKGRFNLHIPSGGKIHLG